MFQIKDNLKVCSNCNEQKPRTEFHKHPKTKDGRNSWCKDCSRKNCRAYYQKNKRGIGEYRQTSEYKKQRLEYEREYRNRPEVKERRRLFDTKRRKLNRAKANARNAVNRAVKLDEMPEVKTLTCADCSQPAQEYHHDNGYDKNNWLDVVPLCKSCHYRRHN